MAPGDQQTENLHALLNQETSRIAWKELLRFFAAGTVIAVAADLDLVQVAARIADDDKDRVGRWMEEGKIAKVSDDQARQWLEADAALWAVVVKPWILVQEPGLPRAH